MLAHSLNYQTILGDSEFPMYDVCTAAARAPFCCGFCNLGGECYILNVLISGVCLLASGLNY